MHSMLQLLINAALVSCGLDECEIAYALIDARSVQICRIVGNRVGPKTRLHTSDGSEKELRSAVASL